MDPEVEGPAGPATTRSLAFAERLCFEIRSAYMKLARVGEGPSVAGEANQRFQRIQELLSDNGKRSLYDIGLYDPFEEEEEGFSDFVQEMMTMMDKVRPEYVRRRGNSLRGSGQRMLREDRDGAGAALPPLGTRGSARRVRLQRASRAGHRTR
ncbi:unnamed protein product [Spirodela intermedia]|uniref:Uncharacterized protein n=1 Tax=Spirodela intermedia TaxID=51605 RepID=A0A7I8I9H9_SPIIN|nr:unnamed protein product [Spirodela intermedia]CAA6654356.1 unnamed protein product [Spirodela intermedia]